MKFFFNKLFSILEVSWLTFCFLQNSSLLDEIKSRHCKAAIGVLHAAKSKSLKHWKDLVC